MISRRSARIALVGVSGFVLVACSAVLGFDDRLGATAAGVDGSVPPVEGIDSQVPIDAAKDAPTDAFVTDSPTGVAVIVSASQNPTTFGAEVTFTALAAGNMAIPTGTITFTDGAAALGTIAIEAKDGVGRALLKTSVLTAGLHTIKATYDGDSRYAAGSAGSSVIDVKHASTTTVLASTPNPAPADQNITFTATVSSSLAAPLDGNVTFKDGATTLGTSAVSSGTAVLTVPLAGGLHSVTARYDGNANMAASSSAAVNQAMTGPRCQGAAANCGAAMNLSCCVSATVPGGSFSRSFDGTGTYNNATNTATVSAFVLDRFEVTVGRYRAFLAAGKGTQVSPPALNDGAHPLIASSGWLSSFDTALAVNLPALTTALKCTFPVEGSHTWTDAPGANETKPMTCLNWYDALAFCAWDGGRLPTEAEWNFTAAEGSQQRVRAFSNPASSTFIDPAYAVYNQLSSLAVGSRTLGNGVWGHSDLSGNVWEWVLDYGGGYPNPCVNCANLNTNANRIFRGGGYVYTEFDTTASRRGTGGPGFRGNDVGVRCARAAP